MEFKDYYLIMDLKRDCTQDDIKKSYRKLARKYHPDVSKERDAEAKFKALGEAYEVLKDPEKRAAYDQLGTNWKGGQDFKAPPNWDEGFEFKGGGFTNDGADAAYSDFFEQLFGQAGMQGGRAGQRQGFQARGEDSHAKIHIDLEDSFNGATQTISLSTPDVDAQGHVQLKQRKLTVKIPKGVKAGQHIRLSGQGNPGVGKGPSGDLYLDIAFKPHALYRLLETDVYLDLPISPWEAALGAKITVPTPNGQVELKVPANSPSGSKLRLKGRGLPTNPAGDFYAVLKIVLPLADTEAAKAVYQQMHEQLDFNPRLALGA